MKRNLKLILETWAVWAINGGWDYVDSQQSPLGMRYRTSDTHSDPTLGHMIAMEKAGDCESARVELFYRKLPNLQRALMFETYVEPRQSREPFHLPTILKAWGISTRVYYDQMRKTMRELGWYLDAIEDGEPRNDIEDEIIRREIVREIERLTRRKEKAA